MNVFKIFKFNDKFMTSKYPELLKECCIWHSDQYRQETSLDVSLSLVSAYQILVTQIITYYKINNGERLFL